MTSTDSTGNQKICVELATSDVNNLKSSVYKIASAHYNGEKNTLDNWIVADNSTSEYKTFSGKNNNNSIEQYEMPRRLDWNLFKRIYDIQPRNYEELISIQGVGPATVRALSLIGELIYGAKASWQDPVKYNFAHGGKDGVPYPVARKTYDQSISYLSSAIEGADIERVEKNSSFKETSRVFN